MQRTIDRPTEITGRGLFTGEPVVARFRPAAADSGITFIRTDPTATARINAHVANVTKRARRTALRNGTLSIETVEHCMAALHAMGIDNLEIEINAGELPGGDGSSKVFVDAFRDAGLRELAAEQEPLIVRDTIRVFEDDAELIAAPNNGDCLEIVYDLDYGADPRLPRQIHAVRINEESFCKEIAPARTYLFEEEARAFQAQGLGKHLTYKDLVVIGSNGAVVENEFRFPNECVRHKILDLVGDLYLAGRPIRGKIFARKSGHSLNHELVRKLLEAIAREARRRKLGGEPVYDARKLRRVLPHRYPFVMIDRVIELDGDRRAVGIKNVSINEPYFQGHYPSHPIMPGVLILEAMAQLGGILLSQKLEHTGKIAVFLAMDHVKFRRTVVPGDQLVLEAEALRVKHRTGHVRCSARVEQTLVAQAEIKFMMVDEEPL